MAIDTNNKKLCLINFESHRSNPCPFPGGASLGQGDTQQMLWGYRGLLWQPGPTNSAATLTVRDIARYDLTLEVYPDG